MEMPDVMDCFEDIVQAHDYTDQGYKNTWYDVDNDPIAGQQREFTIEIPNLDGRIYITAESYYKDMENLLLT